MGPASPVTSPEQGSTSSKSTARTARPDATAASPIPLDAVEAARAVLSGRAHGTAKSRDGSVEAIRVLVVAKRSARGARIKALTQMRQLTFSAPDQLQSQLKGLPIAAFVAAAQGLRPTRSPDVVTRGHEGRRSPRWPIA